MCVLELKFCKNRSDPLQTVLSFHLFVIFSLSLSPLTVPANFNVTLVDGALVVTWWGLPPELGGVSGEGVKVEVNVSGEWVEVGGDNPHTHYSTTPGRNAIHIRVSKISAVPLHLSK